jgi:hypothetical protein
MLYRKDRIRSDGRSSATERALFSCGLILLLFIYGSVAVRAQSFRANCYAAHVSDIAIQCSYLSGQVTPALSRQGSQQGAGIEYVFRNRGAVELLYLRQQESFYQRSPAHDQSGSVIRSKTEYVLASPVYHFENPFSEIEGYAGMSAGVSVLTGNDALTGVLPAKCRLAWGGRAGCTYWITKAIGVKADLLLLFSEDPLYRGSASVSSRSFTCTTVHQLTLGAGLMLKIGGRK